MKDLERIQTEYYQILQQQKIVGADLDYAVFEEQIPFLNQMAKIKNSGISVFDFYKKKHIYNSYNFNELFGHEPSDIDTEYYNSRIHPEDFPSLLKMGISLLKFIYTLPIHQRKDYKLQNEYRILNSQNEYIRVIEQHQTLEVNHKGQLWLALSVLDISPNQHSSGGIISQLVNTKTGEFQVLEQFDATQEDLIDLSKREKEVLGYVKKGFLSKEISHKLSISVNTVNTHRQNILKKLNVSNSIEAIRYASNLHLI